MPEPLIRAVGVLKEASAQVNADLGQDGAGQGELDHRRGPRGVGRKAGRPVPAERLADRQRHPEQHERQRGDRQPGHRDGRRGDGLESPVHPNDDVNMSQSSNDTFPRPCTSPPWRRSPTASCRPSAHLRDALDNKAAAFAGITKIGRTHLMDAVPLTLGQEFSGYVAQLDADLHRIEYHSTISTSWPPVGPRSERDWTPIPSSGPGWRRRSPS